MKTQSLSIKLRPDSIGELITQIQAQGRVVSIFHKAVNIRTTQGMLISLVESNEQMTALSIKCPVFFSRLQSEQISLCVGDVVSLTNAYLYIAGIQIDVTSPYRFTGFITPNSFYMFDPEKIFLIQATLFKVGKREGLLGLIHKESHKNIFVQKGQDILTRLLNSQPPTFFKILSEFVGLGPGFTPSGDDLICGFLLGLSLHQVSSHPWFPVLTPTDKNTILHAAAGTSDGGRMLLSMAVQGRYPVFLLLAAQRLGNTTEATDIHKTIAAAITCGHTSGTDALVGLLLFFKILNNNITCGSTPLSAAA